MAILIFIILDNKKNRVKIMTRFLTYFFEIAFAIFFSFFHVQGMKNKKVIAISSNAVLNSLKNSFI